MVRLARGGILWDGPYTEPQERKEDGPCAYGTCPVAVLHALRSADRPLSASEVRALLRDAHPLENVIVALKRLARRGKLVRHPGARFARYSLPG